MDSDLRSGLLAVPNRLWDWMPARIRSLNFTSKKMVEDVRALQQDINDIVSEVLDQGRVLSPEEVRSLVVALIKFGQMVPKL